MGFDFYGTEIDKEYFDAQEKRFREECLGEIRLRNGNVYVQKELFELWNWIKDRLLHQPFAQGRTHGSAPWPGKRILFGFLRWWNDKSFSKFYADEVLQQKIDFELWMIV